MAPLMAQGKLLLSSVLLNHSVVYLGPLRKVPYYRIQVSPSSDGSGAAVILATGDNSIPYITKFHHQGIL